MILQGDSLDVLKTLEKDSIDTIVTDPPYGYSFMGRDWDRAVPSVDIWQQCLRVLKPGAFMCVMSAPRSDVQNAMISRLMEAGFRLDFTPIYWTYASGFPKAGNISKLVDKRLGVERTEGARDWQGGQRAGGILGDNKGTQTITKFDTPATSEAAALDGSYAGFQPKPAVEVIIVAMKPLSEKTYVDQALANGHGVSWLDSCRIPTDEIIPDGVSSPTAMGQNSGWNAHENRPIEYKFDGARFPANLLASDNVLKDHSKYFNLDSWAETLPFLITPKASKSEKNKGLDSFEVKQSAGGGGGIGDYANDVNSASGKYGSEKAPSKNHHPTVKPLKLMSYLITLFSRPGDTVLDPFVGSGTTAVAAYQLGRIPIGIEREAEYVTIAEARLADVLPPLPPVPEEASELPIDDVDNEPKQLRLV